MHLHLPELVVADHHHGVVAESVRLHQLTDALVVRAHTASDERQGSGGQIVSPFQASLILDAQNRLQTKVRVTQTDDIGLGFSLGRVHVANHMASRSGDALVAGKVEIHQRIMHILGLKSRIKTRLVEHHRGLQQDAAYQVGTAHLGNHLFLVTGGLSRCVIIQRGDIVLEQLTRQDAQAVNARLFQNLPHCIDLDAVLLKHFDVVPMFCCRLIYIEIVLEKPRRRMNHPVKQLLTRSVHQNDRCLRPLGLRVIHLVLLSKNTIY